MPFTGKDKNTIKHYILDKGYGVKKIVQRVREQEQV